MATPTAARSAGCRRSPSKINAWEPEIARHTDAELRAKTAEFRARLADGADLDGILPEAFAVVREASKRWLQMRHFDVQLIGGIVLHQGKIAEMRTGEGKTLVATLAVYLNALEGDGVHVITVNDYLAKRDARWMGVIYQGLGLNVGVLQHGAAFLFDPDYEPSADEDEEESESVDPGRSKTGEVTAEERAKRAQRGDMRFLRPVPRSEAYGADITYGTNNEYGFDYLRDNMATEAERRVQRPLAYGIVDEVDNILIDEARTPLIISGQAEESLDLYRTFARIAPQLPGRRRPHRRAQVAHRRADRGRHRKGRGRARHRQPLRWRACASYALPGGGPPARSSSITATGTTLCAAVRS